MDSSRVTRGEDFCCDVQADFFPTQGNISATWSKSHSFNNTGEHFCYVTRSYLSYNTRGTYLPSKQDNISLTTREEHSFYGARERGITDFLGVFLLRDKGNMTFVTSWQYIAMCQS